MAEHSDKFKPRIVVNRAFIGTLLRTALAPGLIRDFPDQEGIKYLSFPLNDPEIADTIAAVLTKLADPNRVHIRCEPMNTMQKYMFAAGGGDQIIEPGAKVVWILGGEELILDIANMKTRLTAMKDDRDLF